MGNLLKKRIQAPLRLAFHASPLTLAVAWAVTVSVKE